jgi:hypothetical protein
MKEYNSKGELINISSYGAVWIDYDNKEKWNTLKMFDTMEEALNYKKYLDNKYKHIAG